jgi:hypothetical protein
MTDRVRPREPSSPESSSSSSSASQSRVRPKASSPPESSSLGSAASQSRVRGRPFQLGNPGRPPGSKNKLTRFLEELVENEGEEITRKLVEQAKEGKLRPLLYCADRLIPRRRGRVLGIELPPVKSALDIGPAIAAITNGLNNGNLTLEEASDLTGLLERFGRAIMADDLTIRLEQLEARMKVAEAWSDRGGK